MEKKVLEYIKRYQLIELGDHLIVGLSGGADSVCLIHLLSKLKEKLNLTIYAIHVHHGLRGKEADGDAKFVEGLCEKIEVPCFVVHKDVSAYANVMGVSEEEAGRNIRYEIFKQYAQMFYPSKIVVAHHQDDTVETILHHLLRGSGLKGLSGIPNKRGEIIRPLLCCRRKEIEQYLDHEQVGYCFDSTNNSDRYTRNRIRNRLVPLIKADFNEKAVDNILHASELFGEADEYLEQQAEAIVKKSLIIQGDTLGIAVGVIKQQHVIIQKYVIRNLIFQACKAQKDLSLTHVLQILALLDKDVGKEIHLPYRRVAYKDYEILWIKKNTQQNQMSEIIPELVYHCFPFEKHLKIPRNQYTKWFDYDKIKDTLSIRWRTTGDYIMLPGGGKKSVKAFMIDEKIPREQRNKIPLLAEQDHILWIIGYRISEYYKITENTKQVLQVQYDGGLKDER